VSYSRLLLTVLFQPPSLVPGRERGEGGQMYQRTRADNSDIAVGNVLPPGGGANVARMAQLYSGIPYT